MGATMRRAREGAGPAGVRQAGELRSARLESLRAIAALAVLEGHVYGSSVGYGASAYDSWWHRTLFGGGFGVYLFFGLSGYLLYLPFARRDFGNGRRTSLSTYAYNRALRILPLYYVVAITYLAIFRPGLHAWARFLTFTENFSASTVGKVDPPMWSLVVEILFYALLPILAVVVARVARESILKAVAVFTLIGIAAAGYRWEAMLSVLNPGPLIRFNIPANFFFFIPGMLLALAKVRTEREGSPMLSGIFGRSSTWLAASAACWALVFWRYDLDLVAGAGSFLLIGACVLPLRRSIGVRALDWPPLAVLGTASYSLYLWHMPIIDSLAGRPLGGYPGHLIVGAAVCIVVSLASYRLVEWPFLRLRHRWGDTAATQATVPGATVPAAGGGPAEVPPARRPWVTLRKRLNIGFGGR